MSGPSGARGAGDDCETYGYDANGNRGWLMKRDGSKLEYTYDALNRMTAKTVPSRSDLAATHTRDVAYSYDFRGLQTAAQFTEGNSGEGVTTSYDGFGRKISETLTMDGESRVIGSQYDANGNRTRVTHPDSAYFQYGYDGLNRASAITEGGSLALASYSYERGATPPAQPFRNCAN